MFGRSTQIRPHSPATHTASVADGAAIRRPATTFAAASRFTGIANLPESALEKLSGSKRFLGKGSYGSVTRECVEMPHSSQFMAAAKFVAVKQFYDPSDAERSNAALVKLAALATPCRQHVLSAQYVGLAGQVGTQLAHTRLLEFLHGAALNPIDFLVLIRDLSLGLDSLHSTGMFHGDVAFRNLLIAPGGYLVADIDGRGEGDDPTRWVYQKIDVVNLAEIFGLLSQGIANIDSYVEPPCSSLSVSSCLIADELVRRGVHSSRSEQVLNSFDSALFWLHSRGAEQPRLLSLASMADELIGFLRCGQPVVINN